MRRIIALCKEVPLLPITILAAIPLALLGAWRPWETAGVSLAFGPFNPGVGQWIVIALVVYTIVVTVIGMIDDLRHGHVGVDLLAVIAIASTVAVQEYWAAWAVVLMISSGEAIEEFAQSKAEGNLTALVDAAPRTAHVVTLPGLRGHVHASEDAHAADVVADGFRKVAGAGAGAGASAGARMASSDANVSDSAESDTQTVRNASHVSDSGESDIHAPSTRPCLSDSGESDIRKRSIRHGLPKHRYKTVRAHR